jgi:hypothetical protein
MSDDDVRQREKLRTTPNARRPTLPYLLVGNAGGAFKTGRFLKYDGISHNDLLVSLQNAFDIPDTTFGDPSVCSGPLAPGLCIAREPASSAVPVATQSPSTIVQRDRQQRHLRVAVAQMRHTRPGAHRLSSSLSIAMSECSSSCAVIADGEINRSPRAFVRWTASGEGLQRPLQHARSIRIERERTRKVSLFSRAGCSVFCRKS